MLKGGKMKKILLVTVLFLSSILIYADGVKFEAWSGYTTVSMGDWNDFLAAAKLSSPTFTYNKIQDGVISGLNVGYEISPWLIGLKTGYLGFVQTKGSLTVGTTNVNIIADMSLIPIMLGGAYSLELNKDLSLCLGLYGGIGMNSLKLTTNSGTTTAFVSYAGSGFVGDLSIDLNYKVSKGISVGFTTGYRLANILESDVTDFTPGTGYTLKSPLMNFTGTKSLAFDFSGLTLGANVNISF